MCDSDSEIQYSNHSKKKKYIWVGGKKKLAVCFETVFNTVETKAGNVIHKIVQRL